MVCVFPFKGFPLPKATLSRVSSRTHLFLLVIHVVDEQDAVTHSIAPGELLECNSNIRPLVRLPVPPPLQGSSFNPNRLQRKHVFTGGRTLRGSRCFSQTVFYVTTINLCCRLVCIVSVNADTKHTRVFRKMKTKWKPTKLDGKALKYHVYKCSRFTSARTQHTDSNWL